MLKALNYLVKGQSYGGAYKMVGEKYPNLRGMMAWSINWDNVNNKEFVKSYRPFFDSLSPIVPEKPVLKAASVKASAVSNKGYSLTIDVPAYNTATSYELFENGKSIATGVLTSGLTISQSIKKDFSNKDYGTYTYSVVLKDVAGVSAISSNTTVEVKEVEIPSVQEWQSGVSYKLGDKVTYQGKTYECIYVHTSNIAWTPNVVPTLWKQYY